MLNIGMVLVMVVIHMDMVDMDMVVMDMVPAATVAFNNIINIQQKKRRYYQFCFVNVFFFLKL